MPSYYNNIVVYIGTAVTVLAETVVIVDVIVDVELI